MSQQTRAAERLATSPDPAVAAPSSRPRHRFKFYRAGGLDQVALESSDDLLALEQLDQKLWIALSCPTRGLELDPRTLDLLDLDRDGRVRAPEVLAAIRFCAERLRDVGLILFGADALALEAIREDTPEGKAALGAARHVLAHVGRPDATAIRVADVADTTKVFEQTLFNGDGVVPPEAAGDLETRQILLDVIATMGGTADRSGKLGVDRARVDGVLRGSGRVRGLVAPRRGEPRRHGDRRAHDGGARRAPGGPREGGRLLRPLPARRHGASLGGRPSTAPSPSSPSSPRRISRPPARTSPRSRSRASRPTARSRSRRA